MPEVLRKPLKNSSYILLKEPNTMHVLQRVQQKLWIHNVTYVSRNENRLNSTDKIDGKD